MKALIIEDEILASKHLQHVLKHVYPSLKNGLEENETMQKCK